VKTNKRGFTLFEVMIASGLLTIITLSVISSPTFASSVVRRNSNAFSAKNIAQGIFEGMFIDTFANLNETNTKYQDVPYPPFPYQPDADGAIWLDQRMLILCSIDIEFKDFGTAEVGSGGSFTDAQAFWEPNEWANDTLFIVGGTGRGLFVQIASNTPTTLQFSLNLNLNRLRYRINVVTKKTGGAAERIDRLVPRWAADSTSRWNDHVQDEHHGVNPLSLPIPAIEDPHSIIERANPATDTPSLKQEKLEYKTSLRILRQPDGPIIGKDQDGNLVDLSYTWTDPVSGAKETHFVYEFNTFYDARGNSLINSIDVNMARMIEGNIIPPNGILYVSNEDNMDSSTDPGGVRLVEAAQLPGLRHG
jgi:prepilin-type N-terminal cleavage/methylation domain-containing protein